MATWTDFAALFPEDYQAIITELETAYDVDFSITDYEVFAAQSVFTIKTQLASLGDTHALLLAIADYYLAKAAVIDAAGEGSLTAWELLMLSMPVDDLPGTKKLKLYLDSVPTAFDDFQIMSNTDLAAVFAPANTSQQFWTNYTLALTKRTAVLADSEFGGFVMSLPLEEQTSVESMLGMIVAADAGFDTDAMAAISTQALAGQFYSLNTNFTFRYRQIQRIIMTVRELIASYTPDDQFDVQFYSSQGPLMVSALQAVVKSLVGAEVITTVRDIGTLDLEEVLNEVNTWNGSHPFFHGLAAVMLADFRDYERVVAEAAKQPITPFAFQIRPTNGDARPLGGLLVKVMDVTDPGSPVELGTRMLDFNGIAYVQYEGPVASTLDLEFEVMTAEEDSLVTSDPLAFDPATETSIEVEVAVPGLPVNSDVITALATEISLTIPSALGTFLVAEDLVYLDDLRRMGGLANDPDSAVQDNLAVAQRLDHHALLELIEDDAALREFLIDAGYTSPSKIAAKTRADFVTALTGAEYGEVTLAGVYLKASKTTAVLGHLMMAVGAGHASKYQNASPSLSDLFEQQCDCEECRSGVSPLAYLAALLDYGTKYIKNDGVAVDVDWFQETFHQGYCELPANCSAVEKKVCQVRIAIEVLRQYMGSVDPAYVHRREYLRTTYGLLLNQAGVTVDEIRLASENPNSLYDGVCDAIGERMGISGAAVNAFYLDSSGLTPTLTEDNLELLFGFQSTLRNPYSDGLKLLDGSDKIQSWQFKGVQWKRNTDVDGFLYLEITATPSSTVKVYRDSSRGIDYLVGYAAISSFAPYTAEIVEQNDSGLFGRIEMGTGYTLGTTVDTDIKVSVVPKLLAWRLLKQRERWAEQDWPTRNTYFIADRTLPIVEPDMMGPDDIRDITSTANISPVGLWVNRRDFLDAIEIILRATGSDVLAAFDELDDAVNGERTYNDVYTGTPHSASPWDSASLPSPYTALSWEALFNQLFLDLQSPTLRDGAYNMITVNLRLSLEAFTRLNAIFQKYLLNPSSPDFTTEELDDLFDILMQAVKVTFYDFWIQEEDTNTITLTPDNFWPSIREPKEGKWNAPTSWSPFYATAQAVPWIDPGEIGLLDLPDGVWAAPIVDMWQTRVGELATAIGDIYDARTTGLEGFQEMLVAALGALPAFLDPPTSPPFESIGNVLDALNGSDAGLRTDALEIVNQILFLTEDEFKEAAVIMVKEEELDPVSDAEYESLAKVLVNGWRRSQQWTATGDWTTQETISSYWFAFKQKFSRWRSSNALRKQWLEGLAFYSRTPMVDPDLIKAGDIVNPEFNNNATLDNPAYVLWRSRSATIEDTGGWLDTIVGDTFDDNVTGILGVTSADEIEDLQVLYEQNKDVSARLKQLNLNSQRLGVIVKLKREYDNSVTPSGEELSAFHAIMLQVKKERNYGAWNIAEREEVICLSPDFFHPAYPNFYQFIQYLDAILLPWRTSPATRRDWQERLESRIDQEMSMIEGLAGTVKATEDRVLIILRDALINISTATGNNVEEKGEWLTEKFLMDFRIQCCNETTRVAQAIETLQVLYFSIRTGTIVDDYPDLELDNDDWDDDWKWLSTYGTWRSLMFVYLYPENVLLPSLKEKKSGKLAEIMDAVRNAARFTPDMACEVLHDYESYLKDMADLRLQATVTTTLDVERDGCGMISGAAREVDFLFALGGHTRRVYMSTVDINLPQSIAQSHWEPIDGFENIHRIVGARVFMTKSGKRYVYLFGLKSVLNDQPDLLANRLNLATLRWESDLDDLKIEKTSRVETWGIQLAERTRIEDPIYLVGTSYAWLSQWSSGVEGAAEYRVVTTACNSLRDRLVIYNKLNEEGNAWETDDWTSLTFFWMRSFKIIGALFTVDRLLMVMAAVQFSKPDWKLVHFTFNESGLAAPYGAPRIIPTANDFPQDQVKLDPIPPSQVTNQFLNITFYTPHPDPAAFQSFQANSGKLQYCGFSLEPFYSVVNLLKTSTSDLFKLYYNSKIGNTNVVHTQVISFELRRVEYHTYNSTQTNLQTYQNGTLAEFLSLEVDNPSSSQLTFTADSIGPFYSHTASPGVPNRKNVQVRSFLPFQMNNNFAITSALGLYVANGNFLLPLLEHPTSASSLARRIMSQNLFVNNSLNSISNRSYLQEAYYLLPIFLAIELQKNKHYESALELYRLVYDYTLPSSSRKIYYGLIAEESITTSFANVMAWLDDPENPHAIAGMRANTYTRFTIFSIVRCMLEMADQEFTTDSPESVPRARTLYLAARELIRDEIYDLESEGCGALLDELDAEVTDAGWYPEWLRLKAAIAELNNHDVIDNIVNGTGSGTYPGGIAEVFADAGLSWEEKIMEAETLYQSQMNLIGSAPNRLCTVMSDWSIIGQQEVVLGDDETGLGTNRMSGQIGEGFLTDLSLITAKTVGELTTEDDLPWLGEAVSTESGEALELSLKQRLNGESGLYEAYYEAYPLNALRIGGGFKRPFIPYSNHYFCVPQNPVPFNLLLHAELNLFKIRHCRNIAGIHRELDPYGAPTDTTSGMPVIGSNGQISFPGTVSVPPTPYRYEVVLARAKELIQLAGQAEGQLLNTLEKLDAERYSLLRARQDLSTSKATVKLQDLRVRESEHEVDLAEMQRERAQFQVETYQGWIDAGLPEYEQRQLDMYNALFALKALDAGFAFRDYTLKAIADANDTSSNFAGAAAAPVTASILSLRTILGYAQLANSIAMDGLQTAIYSNQIQASFAQRKRDWEFQAVLSDFDVKNASQQIKIANDRLRITGQERAIAQMQATHAEEVVEFLRTKFTNVELYDWMSGVLQRIYSFYLQHATSMAKIAQQQLAFERQEAPANLILDDYWSPPSDSTNVPGVNTGTTVDRRGLTGSARLQMDLTKLDLYSFETEKRKLQLTKTMSLAQLFPIEFEVFRQTGKINFRTKMEWFDRDFPGHYLRLIKRVRTSVIALVPPGEGIRARLATTGVSRVVVGGDAFQTIVTRRGSESVSLTSPIEATGLFEMLPDRGDMLFPFEAMGVDAPWEFRMYKAANPLNFNTIADVLITFEYTALESFEYEEQVKQSFDSVLHGERAFSFRYLFPDQWYDLKNATLTHTPYVVDFELRRGDFPGLSNLKVESVTLMLVTKEQGDAETYQLELWKEDGSGGGFSLGGFGSANASGVISSRSGLLAWGDFIGELPTGKWRLNCSDASLAPQPIPASVLSPAVKGLIDSPNEDLVDILLIIGYMGDSPGY